MNRLVIAIAACLWFAAGAAQAQSPPGGGMSGGRPPGGMRAPVESARIEDMAPADPLRLWREQLVQMRAALALQANQAEAYEGFMRELADMVKLNERRVSRLLTGNGLAVSAVPDIGRDLRQQRDEASDQAAAAVDLSTRWAELEKLLSPEQREAISKAWALSRAQAARGPMARGKP